MFSFNMLIHPLPAFTNSLGPDQNRQNVCPDLDPNIETLIALVLARL